MKKPIYVVWRDAVSHDAWEALHEAKTGDLATIHTLGFLIDETDELIRVALNFDDSNENVSQVIAIPKAWIKSRRFIRTNLKK